MIIVITGPTAVGKTKLSVEIAKKINGEIINADSTQIFKELDIATAKVTKEEMENIPHHLLDIKNINEDYTVFDYQKDCRNKIDEILNRNKIPILVGGTGLYIKAALYDYKFNEETIKNDYSNYTSEELYNKLLEINPKTEIHKNNRKRIERELDKYSNNSVNDVKTNKLLYDVIFIGLTTDREILYNRINNRVDQMLDNGLIEEAKKIYKTGIRTKAVLTPIGYKELFDYFDNKCTLEESIELIKQRSRRYAKRQYTWNRHQFNLKWFDVDFDNFNNTISEVLEYIEEVKKWKEKIILHGMNTLWG